MISLSFLLRLEQEERDYSCSKENARLFGKEEAGIAGLSLAS